MLMCSPRPNRACGSPKGEPRRIRFSNKKFAASLTGIGLPPTWAGGDFVRWDCMLSEEPAVAVLQYLAVNLFSKFQDPDDSSDSTFAAAMEKFRLAESLCKTTNERFSPSYKYHNDWHRYIHVAREELRRLLKVTQRTETETAEVALWREAQDYFGFGPGASTRLTRRNGDKAFKYSGIPETTPNNASLAAMAIATVSPWYHGSCFNGRYGPGVDSDQDAVTLTLVKGNRITTVPKNYKTDRCIAIEPCMNMYIQKGLGGFIRKRLLSVGINLNDQTINQDLALEGSISGRLATIDLSMASDTVSYMVVKTLFPDYLVDAIDKCRSDRGVLPDGNLIRYQKVSSMGNGFTFELESALFWALARAVVILDKAEDDRVSVYGDDIIVSSVVAPKLIELLAYCGFTTNKDKTFISGHFRESCGKHFLSGHDISPFFVRRPVDTIDELMLVHNNFRRWANRVMGLLSENQMDTINKILSDLRNLAPANLRECFIPDGFGDNAFLGNPPDIVLKVNKNGWDGYTLVHRPPSSKKKVISDEGLLTKALERLETGGSDSSQSAPISIYPTSADVHKRVKKNLFVPFSQYWKWASTEACIGTHSLGEDHDIIVLLCAAVQALGEFGTPGCLKDNVIPTRDDVMQRYPWDDVVPF